MRDIVDKFFLFSEQVLRGGVPFLEKDGVVVSFHVPSVVCAFVDAMKLHGVEESIVYNAHRYCSSSSASSPTAMVSAGDGPLADFGRFLWRGWTVTVLRAYVAMRRSIRDSLPIRVVNREEEAEYVFTCYVPQLVKEATPDGIRVQDILQKAVDAAVRVRDTDGAWQVTTRQSSVEPESGSSQSQSQGQSHQDMGVLRDRAQWIAVRLDWLLTEYAEEVARRTRHLST
jgi:hypothetical protein